MVTVIDASGSILGRMSSRVAKMLLMGEQVVIVNAEKAVVSGKPSFIKKEFLHRRSVGDMKKGPFYPRYPDKIVRRAVRGMLPRKKARGRDALKRLRVHIGCPEKYSKDAKKVGKQSSELSCKHMILRDVCKALGAKEERM